MPSSTPVSEPPAHRFRHDIDGLRAVAICAVVAFHSGIAGFDGGFVGVDVFFVISGYLIQTNLFREHDTTGRVRLGAFWARRVRRLAPAMALVTLTTLVAAMALLSPLEWGTVAADGLSTAFYVSNIAFSLGATDYFRAGSSASYFLHTWSLSVEEQFYIVWPLLVLATGAVARRVGVERARARVVVLTLLTVASFGLSMVLTARGTPFAFFSLPTRAWEFGVAGLLVSLGRPEWMQRRVVANALGIGGAACVVASLVAFDGSTPFPGWAAVVPVVGALGLLAAGSVEGSVVSQALAWRPLGVLGRLSYSWYLWHWPAILLAVVAFHDSVGVKSAASLVSLALAALTFRFVEQPVRFHPGLVQRTRATFAMGLALLVLTAGTALALDWRTDHDLATTPLLQRLRAAADEFHGLDVEHCPTVRTSRGDRSCVFGDVDATRTVVLLGDSHALHWVPALDAAARERSVRLVVRYLGGCPVAELHVAVRPPLQMGPHTECYAFRRGTRRLLDQLRPDGVIVSEWSHYANAVLDAGDDDVDDDEALRLWRSAHVELLRSLTAAGTRVGAVIDGPLFASDPARCVARAGRFEPCAGARDEASRAAEPFREAVASAAGAVGAPTLRAMDLLCTPTTCPLEIDGKVVYSDTNHVTATFARTQAGPFGRLLDEVLGGP